MTDNGPETTAQHFLDWTYRRGIAIEYIDPGKPVQNAHEEKSKLRIWGIGLSKTGTVSLNSALICLGFKSGHFILPKFFDDFDAITDVNASVRFKEIDIQYPGSKFIYTIRSNMIAWLDSCANHFPNSSALRETDPDVIEEVRFIRTKLYGSFDFDRGLWERAYYRHHEEVMGYFRNRPDDLLVMDVCAGEGWEKLCPFLCKPIPENFPFPKANVTMKSKIASAPKAVLLY